MGESSTSAAAGTSRMSCRSVLLLCFIIFASMHFGSSCDVSGMQTCNQAYLAGARTASGNETCVVLETMLVQVAMQQSSSNSMRLSTLSRLRHLAKREPRVQAHQFAVHRNLLHAAAAD